MDVEHIVDDLKPALTEALRNVAMGAAVQAFDIGGSGITVFVCNPPASAVLRGTAEGMGRANDIVMELQRQASRIVKPS